MEETDAPSYLAFVAVLKAFVTGTLRSASAA
jgi:hypothetical protein